MTTIQPTPCEVSESTEPTLCQPVEPEVSLSPYCLALDELRKQIARCGNAVPPPFASAFVRANLSNLCTGINQEVA